MRRWSLNGDRWTGGMTHIVRTLLIVTVAAYLVQMVVDRIAYFRFTELFALSTVGILKGHLWQFVSYMFLHGGLLHIALNMLSLFLIGPELERSMGRMHFTILYFLSGVLGGLGWLAMEWGTDARCVGASGAIFGVLGAFAALFPNRPVTLLVFFVLPVTMRAWVMVALLSLIQLMLVIGSWGGGIAYVAHLGGALAGYIYARTVFRSEPWTERVSRRSPLEAIASVKATWDAKQSESDQKEMDRLLDKIASQGIHTLTSRERQFLDQASQRMRK